MCIALLITRWATNRMPAEHKPFSTATWSRKPSRATMLSAHYEDGGTAYFEADRDLVREDHRLLAIALERQATGRLPAGTITSVKRVR